MRDPYRTVPDPRSDAPPPRVLAEVTVVFNGVPLRVEHIASASLTKIYRVGDGPGAHFQIPGEGLPDPEGTPILCADAQGLSLVLSRGLRGTFWSAQHRRPLAAEAGSQPWVTRRLDPHTGCRIDLGSVQVWIRGVLDDAVAPSLDPVDRAPLWGSLFVAALFISVLMVLQRLAEPLDLRPDEQLRTSRYFIGCQFGEPPPPPERTHVFGDHHDPWAQPPAAEHTRAPWTGVDDGSGARIVDLLAAPDPASSIHAPAGTSTSEERIDPHSSAAAAATSDAIGVPLHNPWIATVTHAAVGFRPSPAAPDPRAIVRAVARGEQPSLASLTDPAVLMRLVAPERARAHGEPLMLSVETAATASGHQLARVVVQARRREPRRLEASAPVAYDVEVVARFEPTIVAAFRPIGHRQRVLDDGPDPGLDDPLGVTSGRVIVALYELELAEDVPPDAQLAQLEVHYRPTPDAPRTIRRAIARRSSTPLHESSEALRLAAVAARTSELLAGSPHANGHDLGQVLGDATTIAKKTSSSQARALTRLLRYALSDDES